MLTLLKVGDCWADTEGTVYQIKQHAVGTAEPFKGVFLLKVQPMTSAPLPQPVWVTAGEVLFFMGLTDTKPVYALPPDPLTLS